MFDVCLEPRGDDLVRIVIRIQKGKEGKEGVYVVEGPHGSDAQFVPEVVNDVVGDHIVGGREGLDAVLL